MKLPEGYVNGVPPKKATAMGGFGQQMLERMGWQKGRGLGKESQGISAPLEAVKKDDTVGLGGNRTWNWEHDYAASAYEQAMAKLNVDTAAAGSSSSSDSSSSDSEEEPGTDDSARSACVKFAGVHSSASASELKLARQLAKGNNLGRFGARHGKLERIREQEAVLAAQVDQMKTLPQSTAGLLSSNSRGQSAKTVIIKTTEPPAELRAPPPPRSSSWWGHKAFVSFGWLEGLDETDKPKQREEFTASTQEDIYNRVKDSQRKGKAGMGKRGGRDAAADWIGSKVVFEDPSEPDQPVCTASEMVTEGPDVQGKPKSGSKLKNKVLKIARSMIIKSKRQRVKRVRLEAAVASEMSCSAKKACKRLQLVLDAERLAVADKWIVLR